MGRIGWFGKKRCHVEWMRIMMELDGRSYDDRLKCGDMTCDLTTVWKPISGNQSGTRIRTLSRSAAEDIDYKLKHECHRLGNSLLLSLCICPLMQYFNVEIEIIETVISFNSISYIFSPLTRDWRNDSGLNWASGQIIANFGQC